MKKHFQKFWQFSENIFIFQISKIWKFSKIEREKSKIFENFQKPKSEKWKYFRFFSKLFENTFCYFCSRSCETCILISIANLPRWIPHYGDDISRIRISTSADFHAYWLIFCPKPAFVQYSVKRTEAPGQPRDQIFHEKSSQSCRSPSLTMGNCVTDLLTS